MPIAWTAGVLIVLATFSWADLGPITTKLLELIGLAREHTSIGLAIGAGLVVAASAAFAWPRAIPAEQAGLAKPSWKTWARATGLSLALLAAIVAVLAPGTKSPMLVEPVLIAIVTAVLLDAYDDLRARRVALDRVWRCTRRSAQTRRAPAARCRHPVSPRGRERAHDPRRLRRVRTDRCAGAARARAGRAHAAQFRSTPTPSEPNTTPGPPETSP